MLVDALPANLALYCRSFSPAQQTFRALIEVAFLERRACVGVERSDQIICGNFVLALAGRLDGFGFEFNFFVLLSRLTFFLGYDYGFFRNHGFVNLFHAIVLFS